MNMENENSLSYIKAIEELDKIISDMQNENCDIDNLANNTKRAAFLIDHCRKKLLRTEEEVRKIIETLESND